MSIRISTNVFNHSISWDQYYEQLMNDEHQGDSRRRIDHMLQSINIESKLYNLMSNLTRELIWLVSIFDEGPDASDFLAIIHAAASCSDRVDVRIYIDRSSGVLSTPKAVLTCFRKGELPETGGWSPPPALWALAEADKIIAVQEKLIDLVKIWNE